MFFFRGSPRLGLASNLVCLASASSSPLPCLASVKDIAALPCLFLDLSALTSASALSPSLLGSCPYRNTRLSKEYDDNVHSLRQYWHRTNGYADRIMVKQYRALHALHVDAPR